VQNMAVDIDIDGRTEEQRLEEQLQADLDASLTEPELEEEYVPEDTTPEILETLAQEELPNDITNEFEQDAFATEEDVEADFNGDVGEASHNHISAEEAEAEIAANTEELVSTEDADDIFHDAENFEAHAASYFTLGIISGAAKRATVAHELSGISTAGGLAANRVLDSREKAEKAARTAKSQLTQAAVVENFSLPTADRLNLIRDNADPDRYMPDDDLDMGENYPNLFELRMNDIYGGGWVNDEEAGMCRMALPGEDADDFFSFSADDITGHGDGSLLETPVSSLDDDITLSFGDTVDLVGHDDTIVQASVTDAFTKAAQDTDYATAIAAEHEQTNTAESGMDMSEREFDRGFSMGV